MPQDNNIPIQLRNYKEIDSLKQEILFLNEISTLNSL